MVRHMLCNERIISLPGSGQPPLEPSLLPPPLCLHALPQSGLLAQGAKRAEEILGVAAPAKKQGESHVEGVMRARVKILPTQGTEGPSTVLHSRVAIVPTKQLKTRVVTPQAQRPSCIALPPSSVTRCSRSLIRLSSMPRSSFHPAAFTP